MTICIAAYGWDDTIIAISDRMLSLGGGAITAEKSIYKFYRIAPRWMCMFSANDISPVIPIVSAVQKDIFNRPSTSFIEAADAMSTAYGDFVRQTINRTVYPKLGVDIKTATDPSRSIPEAIADALLKESDLVQSTIDVSFLVFGHDSDSTPHIFSIKPPGVPSFHDTEGFHALGSGEWPALASLMRSAGGTRTLGKLLYAVCAAKFEAENAGFVGKEGSVLFIWHPRNPDPVSFTNDEVQRIRDLWEAKRLASIPSDTEFSVLEKIVNPKISSSGPSIAP